MQNYAKPIALPLQMGHAFWEALSSNLILLQALSLMISIVKYFLLGLASGLVIALLT